MLLISLSDFSVISAPFCGSVEGSGYLTFNYAIGSVHREALCSINMLQMRISEVVKHGALCPAGLAVYV